MRPIFRHALRAGAISALGLAAMFYPFMAGTYDRVAVALSGAAQVVAAAVVLLVPIGLLWLGHDLADRSRADGREPRKARAHWFAVCALVASLLVGAGAALAMLQASAALAIAAVILSMYGVRRAAPAVRRLGPGGHAAVSPASLYLVVVPGVLAIARFTLLETAVAASRHRTIAGATRFIDAIEGYRAAHGHYPPSLESVHHDYDPPTVGVERYRYERQGQAYNVFFEHPTWPIGTREFVMYNPRDEHAMIVHDQDLLESARDQVDRERRFHARAARETGVPRWKYFWFD